MAVVNLNIES